MAGEPLTLRPGDTANSLIVAVRVQPKAAQDRIGGVREGALKVAVTAAPEKGKANKAVQKLLAKSLRIAASQVTLLSGERSHDKSFRIDGVEAARIQALAGDG